MSEKMERFIITETDSAYQALRIVATRERIEEHAQQLRESNRYDRVIVTMIELNQNPLLRVVPTREELAGRYRTERTGGMVLFEDARKAKRAGHDR